MVLVVEGGGEDFSWDSTAKRYFEVHMSWMQAWARASEMMAGWENSMPKPRWMIGWRKPVSISAILGGRERGAENTCKHASKDVVCLWSAGEHVFLQDLLPTFFLQFSLEED